MRTEQYKWQIISGIKSQTFTVSGVSVTPRVIRAGEDIRMSSKDPNPPPHLVVSFNPTGKKYGIGGGSWIQKNTNENYDSYAYGEDVRMYVRCFARDSGARKGRDVCDYLLETVERYLKINSYKLLSGVSIDRHSFMPVREFYVDQESKIYGYELACDVTITNEWTNEPDSGAKSCIPISGVDFSLTGTSAGTGYAISPKIWLSI